MWEPDFLSFLFPGSTIVWALVCGMELMPESLHGVNSGIAADLKRLCPMSKFNVSILQFFFNQLEYFPFENPHMPFSMAYRLESLKGPADPLHLRVSHSHAFL
jgi:hypothetical protein